MCFNKVDYITALVQNCTTHDVKGLFCMPKYSIGKIILHQFHVDNNEVDLGIGYNMIIGRDLMVHLGLLEDFKGQVI